MAELRDTLGAALPAAPVVRLSARRSAAPVGPASRPEYDWLAVGAGFASSVLAERLASERGDRVLVIDRRPHVAGNAYDHLDAAGLLIHQYGPHIFHTNSRALFEHLSRFTGTVQKLGD